MNSLLFFSLLVDPPGLLKYPTAPILLARNKQTLSLLTSLVLCNATIMDVPPLIAGLRNDIICHSKRKKVFSFLFTYSQRVRDHDHDHRQRHP